VTRRTVLVAAFVSAFCAGQQSPFFFVQMSDPQFGMYSKDEGFEQEQANLAFAVAAVNRWRPAFVIVTGDLVNKPGDPAQIAGLKAGIAKLDPSIPVHWVAGNHDVGNEPTPGSLAAYREQFGRDFYSFDAGPIRGIVLDSALIHSPGKASGEAAAQERWLRAELERARRDRVPHLIVFQHHPYFTKDAGEPDEYFNIPAARRNEYLDLFRTYGVRWIFAGHLHRSAETADGSVHMIATGPVGMPLDGARSGLRVVGIQSGISHRYYDFGALPPALVLPLR
jgi:3',5'-cyclic AMP phosphodiesterase CpdA